MATAANLISVLLIRDIGSDTNLIYHFTVENGLFHVKVFDTDREIGKEVSFKFRLISDGRGLSACNFNNYLYFCGIDKEGGTNGSYFFSIDVENTAEPKLLINSNHPHYRPTMKPISSQYIVVLGGKNSTNCELINTKNNKWRSLPRFPEERHNCSALYERDSNFLYVFGGENEEMKEASDVLRLNMKLKLKWESVRISETVCLMRSKAIFYKHYETVLVIGGTVKGVPTENISCLDINDMEVKDYYRNLDCTLKVDDFVYNSLKDRIFFFTEESMLYSLNPHTMELDDLDFYQAL